MKIMTENKGILLQCTNKCCGHKWKYKGKSKFYATCPMCKDERENRGGRMKTALIFMIALLVADRVR
jgi:hypothetical protein